MIEVAVDTSITSTLVSVTIFMAAMIVLVLAAMTVMYRYFNHNVKQQSEVIDQLHKQLTELQAHNKANLKRLEISDNKLKQLARRQYLYEVQLMKNSNYAKAKDLIVRGANVSKVIENCNITKSEAELIQLANRMNKVA